MDEVLEPFLECERPKLCVGDVGIVCVVFGVVRRN